MFGASLVSEQVMKMSREEWEHGARQAQQEQLPLRRDGFGSVYSSDSLMVYEPVWNIWDAAADQIHES